MNKLLSVSVFYKNNLPNGVGCSITPELYYIINNEATTAWQNMIMDMGSADVVAGHLIQQLDNITPTQKKI